MYLVRSVIFLPFNIKFIATQKIIAIVVNPADAKYMVPGIVDDVA